MNVFLAPRKYLSKALPTDLPLPQSVRCFWSPSVVSISSMKAWVSPVKCTGISLLPRFDFRSASIMPTIFPSAPRMKSTSFNSPTSEGRRPVAQRMILFFYRNGGIGRSPALQVSVHSKTSKPLPEETPFPTAQSPLRAGFEVVSQCDRILLRHIAGLVADHRQWPPPPTAKTTPVATKPTPPPNKMGGYKFFIYV